MTIQDDRSVHRVERGAAQGNFPFSRYVAAGNWIYVSGIVGRDPDTSELDERNVEAQTRVALRVVESILEDAGADLGDVVKATIFTTDMDSFADINVAYKEAFGAELPARTCVEVSRLPDIEAQVEIDVVAYRHVQL